MPQRHRDELEPADPTLVPTPDPGQRLPSRADPGVEMLLRLQRGQGNAYASRMAVLARESAPTLARFKPDTAAGSVGGEASQSVDLPGKKGATFEIGDKGYTDAVLDILPAVAGQMFGAESTQNQLLEPVQPQFAQLDRTVRWMAVQEGRAKDNSDTSFSGMAKRAKEEQAGWNAAGLKLTEAGATEDRLCKEFNAGVPRGNRLFVSLARLDGMMALMGISDPKAMTASVVQTLREAQPVAGALKKSGKAAEKKTIPEATDSANAAAKALTSAQREMGIRWMGVQANLENQKAVDTLKEGEKDATRKAEIDEAVKFLRDVGKTVDVSMAVMGVGITGRDRGRRHARGPRGRRPRRRRQGRVGKRRHPEGSDGVGEVDRQGGRAGGSHRRERHPGDSRQALLLQGARTHSPPPGDARQPSPATTGRSPSSLGSPRSSRASAKGWMTSRTLR